MAFKAKMLGRDAVMRKLRELVPEAEKDLAVAQLEAAEDLAGAIADRAPKDSGDYASSIEGARLADKPAGRRVGGKVRETQTGRALGATKDPNATGVFASFKWRWLEFGTAERIQKKTGRKVGRMPAQPHVFPTYRGKLKAIRRRMAGAVNKAVRRIKGK